MVHQIRVSVTPSSSSAITKLPHGAWAAELVGRVRIEIPKTTTIHLRPISDFCTGQATPAEAYRAAERHGYQPCAPEASLALIRVWYQLPSHRIICPAEGHSGLLVTPLRTALTRVDGRTLQIVAPPTWLLALVRAA